MITVIPPYGGTEEAAEALTQAFGGYRRHPKWEARKFTDGQVRRWWALRHQNGFPDMTAVPGSLVPQLDLAEVVRWYGRRVHR
jgi:hypothetical protein